MTGILGRIVTLGLLAAVLLLAAGCRTPAAEGRTPAAEGRTPAAEPQPERGGTLVLRPFTLEDQEGRVHSFTGECRTPVVLIVGASSAAGTNTEWDHALTARYGARIAIFRIVDLSAVVRLFESIAKSRIRDGADPPGVPILLDWDGAVASQCGLDTRETTLLVAGPRGRVSASFRGAPDDRSLEQAASAIDLLLELHHDQ